jgi:hypothetical protein
LVNWRRNNEDLLGERLWQSKQAQKVNYWFAWGEVRQFEKPAKTSPQYTTIQILVRPSFQALAFAKSKVFRPRVYPIMIMYLQIKSNGRLLEVK